MLNRCFVSLFPLKQMELHSSSNTLVAVGSWVTGGTIMQGIIWMIMLGQGRLKIHISLRKPIFDTSPHPHLLRPDTDSLKINETNLWHLPRGWLEAETPTSTWIPTWTIFRVN
jgi:hypothetical protein